MNQKHFVVLSAILAMFIYSCSSNTQQESQAPASNTASTATPADDTKGEGKFKNVELTHPLDQQMVTKGKAIYDVKCNACHKLTSEKLVGPGWKGVTDRRKPEWIMNFVTNTDEMLDKDANAKALLEVCMVRMPNQHLSDDEARQMLEFMRNNDGKN
jgi:cytochrome c2